MDLSHPKEGSVNDGIPKQLCSMKYISMDDAINEVLQQGRNSLKAKIDVKSAFQLLPIHPADQYLLAMERNNEIFIDTCLPFGLCSALKLFNMLADLLAWIFEQQGVIFSLHYLDDFFTVGSASSNICAMNL